jgi:ABC-type transport system substrate-binding protein
LGYGGEVGYYTFNFNHNGDPYLGNPEDPAYPNPRYPNPCSVVSLRQALTHLVDRIALAVGPGEGLYQPIFTPIPASMAFWIHPDISYPPAPMSALAYPPSVADAAALLTADGFLMGGPGGKRYWDKNSNGVYDGASEDLNIIMYTRMDKLRKGAGDALCAGLDDPLINVAYTRYPVTAGQAWTQVMVGKDYHMYTAGWIYIGPDPDYLYDLYHWDNYYHPEDPPNFGAISKHDTDMQTYLWNIKVATNVADALENTLLFQEQFAATASEIPLASTSAPKAYSKWYTGGNNGVAKDPDDGENKYRGLPWTDVVNEKGQGENSWYTTLNAYPVGEDFGDGNMVMRYGWKDNTMPQTLNPMYSSWCWEREIIGRVYDSLGGRDPMTKGPMQVPFLAENWTVGTWVDPRNGETKTAIEVQIRPNVLWSDGEPLTIDDVIYTFIGMPKALRDKGCPDVWWQTTLNQIAGFYRLDEYTIRVLMQVNAVWAVNWVVGNIIVPKHLWEPYIATHTVAEISGDFSNRDIYMLTGTGPFLYIENTPSTVTMIRNPLAIGAANQILVGPIVGGIIVGLVVVVGGYFLLEGIKLLGKWAWSKISPNKIKDDGTGSNPVTVEVPITNLNAKESVQVHKRVELVFQDGHTELLADITTAPIPPKQVHKETFSVPNSVKGKYTLRVTHEIVGGSLFEWVRENVPSDNWGSILGPVIFEENFWITVPGDLNEDGKVNILDIVPIALAFGSQIGGAGYNPAADLNRDGKVNIVDIVLVALDFGWTY